MYGRAIAATLFLFLAGFLTVTACQRAGAATPLVSTIAVAGNRHIDAAMIRAHFHAGAAGRLDAGALDAALKSLYATGLFQDVKISQAGDRVLVTVVENPTIARLVFEGNKKIKDEDLKKALQSKDGGPLSRAIVHDDVEHIIALYRQRGYFDVRVEPKTIDAARDRVNLVFEIKEGDKLAVKEIRFVGNKALPQNKLAGVIKTGTTNVLSFLLDNDGYDADRIEGDLDLLRRFYLAHGYADAGVRSASTYEADKKGVGADVHDRGRPAISARPRGYRIHRAIHRRGGVAALPAHAARRDLRRRRREQERRRRHDGARPERQAVRDRSPPQRTPARTRLDQSCLHGR